MQAKEIPIDKYFQKIPLQMWWEIILHSTFILGLATASRLNRKIKNHTNAFTYNESIFHFINPKIGPESKTLHDQPTKKNF